MKTTARTFSRWLGLAGILLGMACSMAAQTTAPGSSISVGPQAPAEFPRTAVIDILRNPPADATKVETYGTVRSNARAQTGVASSYMLEGDEGGTIEVKTSNQMPPIPNTRYETLGGIVQFKIGDGGVPTPYLMEVYTQRPGVGPVVVQPPLKWWEKYLSQLLLLAAVLMVGVFVLIFLKMRAPVVPPVVYPPVGGGAGDADKTVAGKTLVSDDEITIRRDQTTVKLNTDATRVYFPGHLVIRSGGEVGRKVPLCCSATGGTRMTIGRRTSAPGGDSFIGLDDPTRALSRNQAVFSYDRAGGRVLLENQQASNPTSVDGRPLSSGEVVTLKPGMTVGFPPEYVFEFQAGPFHQA